ncbi:MAG: Kelch repeat-containing protein [Deltaproteobacteria bacterium]
MTRAQLALAALLSALAIATACGPKTVPISVALVTQACAGGATSSPLSGVEFLRFTVSSNGGTLDTQTVAAGAHHLALPQIPLGTANIEVDGLSSSDPSAVLLATGTTGQFTITADAAPLSLTLFLRRAGAFTPTASAQSPAACSHLTVARAYHQQTLLPNGQVFIYGGLQYPATVNWTQALAIPPMVVAGTQYLSSAEIYDPQTGAFTVAANWPDTQNSPSPRAFGQAFALSGGTAIVVGGENAGAPGNQLLDPAWYGGLFDPGGNPVWSPVRTASPHAHGCLAADTQGHLLVSGGYAPPLNLPSNSSETSIISASPVAEYFDPNPPPGPIAPREADALPPDAGIGQCGPTGCDFPIAAGRADQACSGFAGVSNLTANLLFEAGGANVDQTGEQATILGDFFFYEFATSHVSNQPDFVPYLTAPASSGGVVVGGQLRQPRLRAKAVELLVQETGATSPSDAVLVTGGFTCTTPAPNGLPGCVPDFVDGGTSGQLADPPFAYFQNEQNQTQGGTQAPVGQQTELIHFPGNIVTNDRGPDMLASRIDHCAVPLPDGRAVLLGGLGGASAATFGTLSSAEVIYADPASGTAVPASQPVSTGMTEARAGMACTLLPDGSILVTGGIQTTGPLNGTTQPVATLQSAEIFQPVPLIAASK